MRHALLLVLAFGLAACTLTGPKHVAKPALGGGGISVAPLAAPKSAQATGVTAKASAAPPARPAGAVSSASGTGAATAPALSAASASSGTPGVQMATPDTPHPKPRPPGLTSASGGDTTAKPAPPKPKSTLEIRCEASGGIWGEAGNTGAYLCQRKTTDGGKACRKKSDCQGDCLAPSGTCAPVTPLMGCNAVLDDQGRRVTLCLN